MRCSILHFGVICALGDSEAACQEALFQGRVPELAMRTIADGQTVPVFEAPNTDALPASLSKYDCRNNRMAYHCCQQIASTVSDCVAKFGASRIGVVVGSSTSGLDASEKAFVDVKEQGQHPAAYHFHTQHAMGSLSHFIKAVFELAGPAYTVSTACSSAAKAIISARNLIESGLCDAVITGGVDSLCDLTLNGFAALGQLSPQRMNPLSKNRSGLNIGEGGALFVLAKTGGPVALLGGGESVDAYHMSAPHPEGEGAALAMKRALEDAQISADQIVYVNLHGTATQANDAMEAIAVHLVTPNALVSSSKPFFGHCLGAAGAIEAAMCCISLKDPAHRLPGHVFDGQPDATLPPINIALTSSSTFVSAPENACHISNSFAFGGSNCALVLGQDVEGTP